MLLGFGSANGVPLRWANRLMVLMVQRQLFRIQGPWFSKVRRGCVGASGTVDSAGASSSPPTAPISELLTSPSSLLTTALLTRQHGRPGPQTPRPAGELNKVRRADTSPTAHPSRARPVRSQSCSRSRATASRPAWARHHLLAALVLVPALATPTVPPSSLAPPLPRTQHCPGAAPPPPPPPPTPPPPPPTPTANPSRPSRAQAPRRTHQRVPSGSSSEPSRRSRGSSSGCAEGSLEKELKANVSSLSQLS
jgi:hypothetical protein